MHVSFYIIIFSLLIWDISFHNAITWLDVNYIHVWDRVIETQDIELFSTITVLVIKSTLRTKYHIKKKVIYFQCIYILFCCTECIPMWKYMANQLNQPLCVYRSGIDSKQKTNDTSCILSSMQSDIWLNNFRMLVMLVLYDSCPTV